MLQINLVTQVASIQYKLKVKNEGNRPVEAVQLCYPSAHEGHEAILEVLMQPQFALPLLGSILPRLYGLFVACRLFKTEKRGIAHLLR